MYIHEAVEKAMTEGKLIARRELVGGAKDEYAALKIIVRLPCRMVLIYGNTVKLTRRFWNPSQDDLTADDWILIDPAPEVTRAEKNKEGGAEDAHT